MMPEKTIITSGSSNSSPLNPLSSPIICHVCNKQFPQYTCPRCNFPYCSLPCHKSHSVQCTKNPVEPSSSSEGKVDEVSLGFQRDLASGELSKTIQPWDPWWLLASARIEGTQLVQCVEEEAIVVPRGPDTPLISLSKITKMNPSPFLRFHLIDILYSYCFTLRIYNGEWQSDSLGAATMVLTVSSVLGHNGRPETIKEALSFCLEKTCSPDYKNLGGGLKFGLNLVDDVICLLSVGSRAMVCLLCDLQRLILGAIKEVQSSSGRDLEEKLQLAEKKMFFMMCWVNEQSSEVWEALEQSVRAETNSGVEHK